MIYQRFKMKLTVEFVGEDAHVEVHRSPNMNGFLHEVLIHVLRDDQLGYELTSIKVSEEQRGLIIQEADRLWDEYWTVERRGGPGLPFPPFPVDTHS